MKLSQAPPEPYLALLALGKQVYLRGNAGSETMKAAVLAAAKKVYFDREVIDEMRVDSKPPIKLDPAVTNLTVKTFPPRPTFDGPGVLGFVRPPQPWLQVPLTVDHPVVTLEWLVTQGLFSKDFDARQAWPDFESWLPKLPVNEKKPPPHPLNNPRYVLRLAHPKVAPISPYHRRGLLPPRSPGRARRDCQDSTRQRHQR